VPPDAKVLAAFLLEASKRCQIAVSYVKTTRKMEVKLNLLTQSRTTENFLFWTSARPTQLIHGLSSCESLINVLRWCAILQAILTWWQGRMGWALSSNWHSK
jgi:hypothetical protein